MYSMKSRQRTNFLLIAGVVLVLLLAVLGWMMTSSTWLPDVSWNETEMAMLKSLSISNLPPLPRDPSNLVADDVRAAAFGHKLFFDSRLSLNGQISCSTCHLSGELFQDGKPLSEGIGRTNRRAMSIIGTAYSPWFFWDGRKDSQWAQALGPLENPVEHGGNRLMYAHLISNYYREEYQELFGELPDLSGYPENAGPVSDEATKLAWESLAPEQRDLVTRIYANIGKAIAAYERLIMPGPSRFDSYLDALVRKDFRTARQQLSPEEINGLRLFTGKANCVQCHNGPLLTDNHFHNTGVPVAADLPPDLGRSSGALLVLADEFNCLSLYSDADPQECSELRFLISDGEDLIRQYKPPSLRNVAERAPYMHAGQLASLEQVLEHYNQADSAPLGHSELKPLELTEGELEQLIAFLHALSGPLNIPQNWLESPFSASSQ